MEKYVEKMVEFCEKNFNLNDAEFPQYDSLSVAIVDCVYSLQMDYENEVKPIVEKYKKFLNEKGKNGDSLKEFLEYIEEVGGCQKFADAALNESKNKQNGILKAEICKNLARRLYLLGIDTHEDFVSYFDTEKEEILEVVIMSVKGVGIAALNYLFMLNGDPNRCKIDTHLTKCIKEACGYESKKDEDYQILMKNTVEKLNKRYPKLTMADLDYVIWNGYSSGKK